MPGSGSEKYRQLYRLPLMMIHAAAGMRSNHRLRSDGPASRTFTVTSGSSLNRFASTHPDEPAPITM